MLHVLVLLVLLLSFSSPSSSSTVPAPWPQLGRDGAHSSTAAPGTAVGSPNATIPFFRWRAPTGDAVRASAVIDGDGHVYVGSTDGLFYSFEGATGALRWSVRFSNPLLSTAVILPSGDVFVCDSVTCKGLNPTTGAILYSVADTGGTPLAGVSPSPVLHEGSAIVSIIRNNYDTACLRLAFNTGSGRPADFLRFTPNVFVVSSSSTSIAADTSVVFSGSNAVLSGLKGTAECLSNNDAYPALWTMTADIITGGTLALDQSLLYFGTTTGNILALSMPNPAGSTAWTFPTSASVLRAPALNSTRLVFGSLNGNVYCLHAATGALLWSFGTMGGVECTPAISAHASPRVYVGSRDKHLYALDLLSGDLLWKVKTGDRVASSPAIAFDGTVVFGSDDGIVYSVVECKAGEGAVGPGNTCAACPAGTVPNPPSGCVECPAGSFAPSPGSTVCLPCVNGTYGPNTGSSSCLPCRAGTYSRAGALVCDGLCPLGTSSPDPASPNASSCSPCAVGFYGDALGASSCSPCPLGTHGIGAGGATSAITGCSPCPRGTRGFAVGRRSEEDACLPCGPGSYADQAGSLWCSSCPAGTFFGGSGATNLANCSLCPLGQLSPGPGASSCIGCPVGLVGLAEGQATLPLACQPCQPGSYNAITGQASLASCVPCSPGTYAVSSGSFRCELCGAGLFSDVAGASEREACRPCRAGTYNPAPGQASAACAPCPAGTRSSLEGANSSGLCLPCEPGSAAAAGSTVCSPCESGQYAAGNGSAVCSLCPRGSHGTGPGGTGLFNCTPCPSYRTTLLPGAASADECVAASFSCPALTQPRASLASAAPQSAADCAPLVCRPPLFASAVAGVGCVGCGPGTAGGPGSCVRCNASAGEVCPGVLAAPLFSSAALAALSSAPVWTCAVVESSDAASTSSSASAPASAGSEGLTQLTNGTWGIIASAACAIALALVAYGAVAASGSGGCMRKPASPLQHQQQHQHHQPLKHSAGIDAGPRGCFVRLLALGLEAADAFSLAHPLRNGESVTKRATALGGVCTIAGVAVVSALAGILVVRRDADNVVRQESLNVLEDGTMGAWAGVAWMQASGSTGGWSGVRIRLTAAGDAPGACAAPLSWSASGVSKGAFALTAHASCGLGGAAASVSQLEWSCADCVFSAEASVLALFDYSCQVLAMEASAVRPDGEVTTVRTSTGLSPEDSAAAVAARPASPEAAEAGAAEGEGLVTDLTWRVAPLFSVVEDRTRGTRSRGYTLLPQSRKVTRRGAGGAGLAVLPLSLPVRVTVSLPLQPLFASATLSEKTSVVQLIASILGLSSAFVLFQVLFQYADRAQEWATGNGGGGGPGADSNGRRKAGGILLALQPGPSRRGGAGGEGGDDDGAGATRFSRNPLVVHADGVPQPPPQLPQPQQQPQQPQLALSKNASGPLGSARSIRSGALVPAAAATAVAFPPLPVDVEVSAPAALRPLDPSFAVRTPVSSPTIAVPALPAGSAPEPPSVAADEVPAAAVSGGSTDAAQAPPPPTWLRHVDGEDVWFTPADGSGPAAWDAPEGATVVDAGREEG